MASRKIIPGNKFPQPKLILHENKKFTYLVLKYIMSWITDVKTINLI